MADNIEQLIEAVQEQGIETNNVLRQSVDFEDLQLEALFEIKDVLIDTQLSFMEYFASEQERFNQQQLDLREKELADIERNRELKDTLTSLPTEQAKASKDKAQQDASGSAFAGGLVGGGLAGGGLAGAIRGIAKRFLPLAAILGVGAAAVRFLENLSETGDAMGAAGATASDIYDFAILPVLSSGLEVMAKEIGANNAELEEAKTALREFSENVRLAGEDIFRDLKRFFGEESSREAAAESEQRIGELRTELREVQQEIIDRGLDASPGGEIETGLSRLAEISAREEEMRNLPKPATPEESRERAGEVGRLREERRKLRVRLAPVLEEQRIQKEIQQEQERSRLAQAGYEAGDLELPAQKEFAGLTSQEKKQYFMDNVSPSLKQASETGAIDIDLSRYMANVMNPLTIAGGGAVGIPLDGIDLDRLKTLPPKQLEAILLNDDILLNSGLQVGALPTSDRMVVEHLYRQTTTANASTTSGFAARPFSQPSSQISPTAANLTDTSNMIEAAAPVPTARNFDASLNALLNAPIGRASQEINNSNMGPVIINAPQKGGDSTVVNNNNQTSVHIGGGVPARSSDKSHLIP